MFSKKKSNNSVDTFIGENSSFEGNIDSKAAVRIDGKITGQINTQGDIVIGEKGTISGDISANNILISGLVKGNVLANGQLRLTTTANLTGDIEVNSFIADEGAIFYGKCTMLENATSTIKNTESPYSAKNENETISENVTI